MFDINEVPYAEWLEKSLQAIVPLKPVCLCFAATMPDGEVYTGYYNADATDKAVIAHNIQADITMDIIRTNAAIIVTKSICGSVARKAWVTPQYSPKQSGLLALIRRLIRGRAQRTADRKRRERVSRGGGAERSGER